MFIQFNKHILEVKFDWVEEDKDVGLPFSVEIDTVLLNSVDIYDLLGSEQIEQISDIVVSKVKEMRKYEKC